MRSQNQRLRRRRRGQLRRKLRKSHREGKIKTKEKQDRLVFPQGQTRKGSYMGKGDQEKLGL